MDFRLSRHGVMDFSPQIQDLPALESSTVAETKQHKKRKRKRKCKKAKAYDCDDGISVENSSEMSEHQFENSDVKVMEVFKILLQKFNGHTNLSRLKKVKGLLPESVDACSWFKKHEDRFLLFEKEDDDKYVTVYCKRARLCYAYNKNDCKNEDCKYLHICMSFLTGGCSYKRCLSHDFFDDRNISRIQELGLGEFKNKDVAKIVRSSIPEVCRWYQDFKCIYGNACFHIHICRTIECNGQCGLEHQLKGSGHNVRVLKAHHMYRYADYLLDPMLLYRQPNFMQMQIDMQQNELHQSEEYLNHVSKHNVNTDTHDVKSKANRSSSQRLDLQQLEIKQFQRSVRHILRPMEPESRIQPVAKQPMKPESRTQPVAKQPMEPESRTQPVAKQPMKPESRIQPVAKQPMKLESRIQPVAKQPMKPESRIQSVAKQPMKPESRIQSVARQPMKPESRTQPVARQPMKPESRTQPVARQPMKPESKIQPVARQPMKPESRTQPVARQPMKPESRTQPVARQPMKPESRTQPVARQPMKPESKIQPVARQPMELESKIQPVANQPMEPESRIQPVARQPMELESKIQPVAKQPMQSESSMMKDGVAVRESITLKEGVVVDEGLARLPYQWQIRMGNRWRPLEASENERVEESFCNFQKSSAHVKVCSDVWAVITFETMTALTYFRYGDIISTSVQRQSTASYVTEQDGDMTELTQWCWYFQDGFQWFPYESGNLQYTLELKYQNGQRTYLFELEPFRYKLDFSAMTQTNLKTLKLRQVTRRPMFVSSDDVKKQRKMYHPCLLREKPNHSTGLPASWAPLDLYQPVELVELHQHHTAMNDAVQKLFFSTMDTSDVQIKSVYRVQNTAMWEKYCSMKKTMEMSLSREGDIGPVNERQLFHGTVDDIDVVRGICHNNVDFRLSGKHGTVFGHGAYFARNANYSHRYTKGSVRYMFLSKVLIGQYTKGDGAYQRPPSRKGHILFDSCVNDVVNPSVFVIFDTAQSYPEFLIEYTVTEPSNYPDRPTSKPVPFSLQATSKPVPTSLPATSKPVPTSLPATSKPVPTSLSATSKPVPFRLQATSKPVPTSIPATSKAVPTSLQATSKCVIQ